LKYFSQRSNNADESVPLDEMTPREIGLELDKSGEAKKAVAAAAGSRYGRPRTS
jgi:hypothetical protein